MRDTSPEREDILQGPPRSQFDVEEPQRTHNGSNKRSSNAKRPLKYHKPPVKRLQKLGARPAKPYPYPPRMRASSSASESTPTGTHHQWSNLPSPTIQSINYHRASLATREQNLFGRTNDARLPENPPTDTIRQAATSNETPPTSQSEGDVPSERPLGVEALPATGIQISDRTLIATGDPSAFQESAATEDATTAEEPNIDDLSSEARDSVGILVSLNRPTPFSIDRHARANTSVRVVAQPRSFMDPPTPLLRPVVIVSEVDPLDLSLGTTRNTPERGGGGSSELGARGDSQSESEVNDSESESAEEEIQRPPVAPGQTSVSWFMNRLLLLWIAVNLYLSPVQSNTLLADSPTSLSGSGRSSEGTTIVNGYCRAMDRIIANLLQLLGIRPRRQRRYPSDEELRFLPPWQRAFIWITHTRQGVTNTLLKILSKICTLFALLVLLVLFCLGALVVFYVSMFSYGRRFLPGRSTGRRDS